MVGFAYWLTLVLNSISTCGSMTPCCPDSKPHLFLQILAKGMLAANFSVAKGLLVVGAGRSLATSIWGQPALGVIRYRTKPWDCTIDEHARAFRTKDADFAGRENE